MIAGVIPAWNKACGTYQGLSTDAAGLCDGLYKPGVVPVSEEADALLADAAAWWGC